MKTTWTPGPWRADQALFNINQWTVQSQFLHVNGLTAWHGVATVFGANEAEVASTDGAYCPEQAEPNARLIAAAPEMAAVLSGTTGAFLAVLLENMAARLVMLGASEDDDLVVEARSRATKTRAILARIKGKTP